MIRFLYAVVGFSLAFTSPALAQIAVSYEARDANGEVVPGGLVSLGETFEVDVLLSVGPEGTSFTDVRQIQLDFSNTEVAAQLLSLMWLLDPDVYFLVESGEVVSASNLDITLNENLVAVTSEPIRVLTATLILDGPASFDALGPQTSVTTFAGDELTIGQGDFSGSALSLNLLGQPQEGDRDGDGVLDVADAFPTDPQESVDTDGDGIGNNADEDDDGDGVNDVDDEFPFDAAEQMDSDFDGVGDNADAFPNDRTETIDSDGDGVGDNADTFPLDSRRSGMDESEFNTGPRTTGGLCGTMEVVAWFMPLTVLCWVRRRSH
ncbi:MAG: hypothetical protein ACPGXK_06925 [Phycisphaerae bacterium]